MGIKSIISQPRESETSLWALPRAKLLRGCWSLGRCEMAEFSDSALIGRVVKWGQVSGLLGVIRLTDSTRMEVQVEFTDDIDGNFQVWVPFAECTLINN